MKNVRISFDETTTIITYDLSPCKISADDICEENSMFHTSFYVKDNILFNLPNTTLLTVLDKNDAEKEFREAVENLDSKEKITKLFIFNVSGNDAFVENDE